MEMYKDAVCNELRQMLTAFEGRVNNSDTPIKEIKRLRLKVLRLCAILDQIEKLERKDQPNEK